MATNKILAKIQLVVFGVWKFPVPFFQTIFKIFKLLGTISCPISSCNHRMLTAEAELV